MCRSKAKRGEGGLSTTVHQPGDNQPDRELSLLWTVSVCMPCITVACKVNKVFFFHLQVLYLLYSTLRLHKQQQMVTIALYSPHWFYMTTPALTATCTHTYKRYEQTYQVLTWWSMDRRREFPGLSDLPASVAFVQWPSSAPGRFCSQSKTEHGGCHYVKRSHRKIVLPVRIQFWSVHPGWVHIDHIWFESTGPFAFKHMWRTLNCQSLL